MAREMHAAKEMRVRFLRAAGKAEIAIPPRLTYTRRMMTAEFLTHIQRDAAGTAWIDDTGVKVIQVAQAHLGHGWSAEAIHENYPHLSLAQIHAALSWFFDHQEEMEKDMALRESRARNLLAETGESPLQRRLRQLKESAADVSQAGLCSH